MYPITKEAYEEKSKGWISKGPLCGILERLEKLNINRVHTIVGEDSFGYWVNWNKSKKITTRTDYCGNEFTLLRECEDCGKLSTPKKIQNRYLFGLQFEIDKASERCFHPKNLHPMLCMSCYNKIKPYHNKLVENEELRLQVGRLQREIYKQNKKVNK